MTDHNDSTAKASRRSVIQGLGATGILAGSGLLPASFARGATVAITPKTVNRQWLFAKRPEGQLTMDTFKYQEVALGDTALKPGEILVHNKFFSLAPSQRVRMDSGTTFEAEYSPPFKVGQPLSGGGVSEVVMSNDPKFPVGSLVQTPTNWEDYSRHSTAKLAPALPAGINPIDMITVYGGNALTAYFGLLRIGELKEGETVVVSGASGGVGTNVMQIARIKKCKVIGIAGGAEKCAHLVKEFGAYGTIDYKAENVSEKLKKLAPDGVDVYFDNVGGTIGQDVVDQMRKFGRVTLCGAISSYDKGRMSPGPRDMLRVIIYSVKLQGFLSSDFAKDRDVALADLRKWKEAGQLVGKADIRKGFKQLPASFFTLFTGEKEGQLAVENA